MLSSGVSLFSGAAVTTLRCSGMGYLLNPRGVAEHHHHRLLAARRREQVVGAHVDQRRRVDVERDEVGVAGLQVGYLVQVAVLAADDVAGRTSRENVALTWRLGANSKSVSVSVPCRTRTAQLEPLWSWIGERCPLRQHITQA